MAAGKPAFCSFRRNRPVAIIRWPDMCGSSASRNSAKYFSSGVSSMRISCLTAVLDPKTSHRRVFRIEIVLEVDRRQTDVGEFFKLLSDQGPRHFALVVARVSAAGDHQQPAVLSDEPGDLAHCGRAQ